MKLHGYEAKAFLAWSGTDADFDVLSFKAVAEKAAIDLSKVRRAVRGLQKKGLTRFVRVSWTDEGVPYGAGYGLTREGRQLLSEQETHS